MNNGPTLALTTTMVALLAALSAVSSAPDAPPAPTATDPGGDGWVMLFDGESLDDWEFTNFGGEGPVTVRDGCIFIDYGADLTGVHREWPLQQRINYEIQLEARKVEGQDFFVGMSFPVRDEYCSLILGGWGGGVCGLSSIDSYDASENETTTYQNFETGRWYRVRVRVLEHEIVAWVDDELILRVDTEGKRFSQRFEVEASRPFGLCSFQTQSATRNIRVRPVDPNSPE